MARQRNKSFEAYYGKNVNPPEKSYELESNLKKEEMNENLIDKKDSKENAKTNENKGICGKSKKLWMILLK